MPNLQTSYVFDGGYSFVTESLLRTKKKLIEITLETKLKVEKCQTCVFNVSIGISDGPLIDCLPIRCICNLLNQLTLPLPLKKYSKTCLKRPLKNRQNTYSNNKW